MGPSPPALPEAPTRIRCWGVSSPLSCEIHYTLPMTDSPITIRPGQPTVEEGLVCAKYLDTAAEGFFGILLGRRAPEIVAHAYTQPGNEYSFENVLFATREDRIVGMALGFTAEERRGFPPNPLKSAKGYPRLRAGVIGFVASPMFRILEILADGDFYVLSLAVDPEQRGHGIGSALIEATEERARASGSTRCAIDVAAKNKGAQRLYTRHSFEVYAKWPKHLNLAALSLLRMAKPIHPD